MQFPTLICKSCLVPMTVKKIGIYIQEVPKRYRAADEWGCPRCNRRLLFISQDTKAFYSENDIEAIQLKGVKYSECPYCEGTRRVHNDELGTLICPMCRKEGE